MAHMYSIVGAGTQLQPWPRRQIANIWVLWGPVGPVRGAEVEERPPPSLVGPSCGGREGLDPPFRGAGRVRSREQAVGGAEQWEDPHVHSERSKTECPVPRRQGQGSCGHTCGSHTLPGGRAPCPRERGPCGVMNQEGTCSNWLCMGREAGSQGLCPGDPAPQHAGPMEGSCGTAAAACQRPGSLWWRWVDRLKGEIGLCPRHPAPRGHLCPGP